jgi:hypothetical protein
MSRLFILLPVLLTSYGFAQTPLTRVWRDSVPEEHRQVFPPDLMPNSRTDNSFYRYKSDPATVMRATLDNMPVKVTDSTTRYTMLRSYPNYVRPNEPPSFPFMPFLKPVPPVLPKNWKKEH